MLIFPQEYNVQEQDYNFVNSHTVIRNIVYQNSGLCCPGLACTNAYCTDTKTTTTAASSTTTHTTTTSTTTTSTTTTTTAQTTSIIVGKQHFMWRHKIDEFYKTKNILKTTTC